MEDKREKAKAGKPPLPGGIHPAVMAVWAAIVAAGHLLPTVPMFGTGSAFSLSAVLSPLSGILFGPIAGALCSACGGFIGSLIAPHTAWLGLGTFVIGTATAFTAGCIAWGRRPLVSVNAGGSLIVNGGVVVYIAGAILWFTQETGRSAPLFPLVYYGAGFIALVTGNLFAGPALSGGRKGLQFPAVWLCAFGGMIGGATVGNFCSLALYKLPREIWLTLTVVAPLERAVFSLGAMLIGVPLLAGLPRAGIAVGPRLPQTETPAAAPETEPSEAEPPGTGTAQS